MSPVVLIGYMGAGKTTIGRQLALNMKVDFYDLDWYIEDRFRKKIPQIFAEKGEEGFRDLERRMLHEVAEFEDVVVSCGGGTPCFFDNMDYLNARTETVWLRATPEVLQAHLGMGKSVRPLIQGKTPEELHDFIVESLRTREPFYAKAKHIIDIEVIHTKEQIDKYVKDIASLTANNTH